MREQQIQLCKPWNANLVKTKGSGSFQAKYVEHTHYTQKLIALIPDLNIETGSLIYDKVEDMNGVRRKFVTGVEVTISGTIDGAFRTITEYGMCDKPFYNEDPTKIHNNGQRAKEAISDGIKRCAMRGFAMGIELYGKDAQNWLGTWLEGKTENKVKVDTKPVKPKTKTTNNSDLDKAKENLNNKIKETTKTK
tara:strand:+ start:118 stop:696 length:579 start_codon:yes stop_codon:yes gene_type:complete